MKIHEILKKIDEGKKNLEFMPTGLTNLDEGIDGGFVKDELVVIGGFTGLGKSFLSAQILYNIAKSGYKTAYFSLEITNQMVISRLIGQEGDIKSVKVITGNMSPEEHIRKIQAEAVIQGYSQNMDFYDNLYDFDEIVKEIRAQSFEFIVIDFIQNIIVKGMDEYERLSYISLQLQKLAKEKHCCILLLSQLSNTVARSTETSQLEYKGSGSIATVCDLGFYLLRDFDLGVMTLILKKNRRGSSGLSWQFMFKGEGGKIV